MRGWSRRRRIDATDRKPSSWQRRFCGGSIFAIAQVPAADALQRVSGWPYLCLTTQGKGERATRCCCRATMDARSKVPLRLRLPLPLRVAQQQLEAPVCPSRLRSKWPLISHNRPISNSTSSLARRACPSLQIWESRSNASGAEANRVPASGGRAGGHVFLAPSAQSLHPP